MSTMMSDVNENHILWRYTLSVPRNGLPQMQRSTLTAGQTELHTSISVGVTNHSNVTKTTTPDSGAEWNIHTLVRIF